MIIGFLAFELIGELTALALISHAPHPMSLRVSSIAHLSAFSGWIGNARFAAAMLVQSQTLKPNARTVPDSHLS
ncbi:MAG TPA: hypothetical protein VGO90_01305 [Chthoniobacteraceae bacterium]|nr:hypothetical protein [Chthoniobacteraceae bacterium]